METPMRTRTSTPRSGFALASTAVVLVILVSLGGLFLSVGVTTQRELDTVAADTRAFYLAEAALTEAHATVQASVEAGQDAPKTLGTEQTPARLHGGDYWATVIADNASGTFTIRATGSVHGADATVEAVLVDVSNRPFDNALFAGNSSGDLSYELEFGGGGLEADQIDGDVYSGAKVTMSGDANVTGTIRAVQGVNGGLSTGDPQKAPDMTAMKFETSSDFDVAALFSGAAWQSDAAGGSAWQVPEDNPAHIFRKNPDDRKTENNSTAKDDFYLEDPYEPVGRDVTQDGSDPYRITLTGDGELGPSGNEKVFFIDGNLWVHNHPSFSFRVEAGPNAKHTRVTFVVKGNIYFSDNVFYEDENTDAVAFLAIKDSNEADSGNIYFGDPRGGTLEEMYAYMYAENNFYDYHLDAVGSKSVYVKGAMTAGNHVEIDRDYMGHHSKLAVDFDDRLSTGQIELPGMPVQLGGGAVLEYVSWRRVGG